MNDRKKILRAAAAFLVALSPMTMGACAFFGEPVEVHVTESGRSLVAEGKDNMTVRELLRQAGVDVSEHDMVTPSTDTVWRNATDDEITVSHYAEVTVVNGDNKKKVGIYDGTVLEAVLKAGYNPDDYTTDEDLSTKLTDGMTIALAHVDGDFVEKDGTLYYYIDGKPQTDAIVGHEDGDWYYADSKGVIDKGYCDGITVDGFDWNIINGKAYSVESDRDQTLHTALQYVAKWTKSGMTVNEKLKACFDNLKSGFLEGTVRGNYRETDWPIVYANDLLKGGKGDCYSYAAAFAFMAKGIGCEKCYVCNSGGHGWAEIDGLIYDPEWSSHIKKHTYFAMSYQEECDQGYDVAFNRDVDWMYVKV